MSQPKWRVEILARRAALYAAALASAGGTVGCDKDKSPSMCLSLMPSKDVEQVDVGPALCLRGTLAVPSAKPAELDHAYPYVVKAGGVDIEGTILAKVEGPSVPYAAHVATGAHMRVQTRSCFIEAARKGNLIEGTVEVTLDIAADGSVKSATTSGTLDQDLRDCIADGAKKVGFNPVQGGGSSKVILAVNFPKKG